MADLLGIDQQQSQAETTTDFLGNRVPLSFKNQPALPTGIGGPAAAGVSTAPATIAGTGTAAPQGPGAFGDLAGAAIPGAEPGGGGAPGVGGEGGVESPGVGQNIDAAAGPGNIGLSFGVGPGSIGIGPTGTISLGGRGDTAGLTQALTMGLSAAGIPTGVNIPSLVASLVGSPVLGIAAQLAGAAGAPFTIAALAHTIASMSPTSITNLQAALADPNPEAQISAAQALALTRGGALGPTQGGPQNIGSPQAIAAGIDNPVNNPNASTQAAPTAPAANLAEAGQLTPTFAALAEALGLGREDMSGPSGDAPGPPGPDAPTGPTGGDPGTAPF